MRGALDRRMQLLETLNSYRSVTVGCLAEELKASKATIRRDIEALSSFAPIISDRGRNGGIRIEKGWYIGRVYLSTDQELLLRRLVGELNSDDRMVMQEIINKFSRPH